jgi:hypothetical protein
MSCRYRLTSGRQPAEEPQDEVEQISVFVLVSEFVQRQRRTMRRMPARKSDVRATPTLDAEG